MRKVLVAGAFLAGGPPIGAALIVICLVGLGIHYAGPTAIYGLLFLPLGLFLGYFWGAMAALATGVVAALISAPIARDATWIAIVAATGAVASALLRLELLTALLRPGLDLGSAVAPQTFLMFGLVGGVSAAVIAWLVRRLRRARVA